MNKVQQINLGGVPFTIDEDALGYLSRYLDTIHAHFRQSEGYEEITQDIEARLAELFQEGLGHRQIVALKDVEDAIVIMGTPEDFGAEPLEESGGHHQRQEDGPKGTYRTGKRLFRNPEDEVVGGVCSGIAAYFGVNDPLWVRLTFIVFVLSGGFGVPLYLILWAILPKAETASDRLAMRGEPINVSNIGKIIEEEVAHISNKVSELSSELGGKDSKKKAQSVSSALNEALRQIVSIIGKVLGAIIGIISNLWKPILVLIGGALILGFLASWMAAISGTVFFWPYLEYFSPEWPMLSMLGAFNIFIIIGMFLLSAGLSITRLLYGTRMSRPWRIGLSGFGVLNFISLFLVLTFMVRDFSNEASVERSVGLSAITTDTLNLRIERHSAAGAAFSIDNDLSFYPEQMKVRNVDIAIRRGEGEGFLLRERLQSRGTNQALAEELALGIAYEPKVEGDVLTLPDYLSIPRGTKWRVQEVDLTLQIPEGKFIRFDGAERFSIQEADKAAHRPRIYDNPGSIWEMTDQGLVCLDCRE